MKCRCKRHGARTAFDCTALTIPYAHGFPREPRRTACLAENSTASRIIYATMSRDMEERYLETRDRNLLLRKKNNEQEQTIKRLYTKIQMIEEGLRRRGHGTTMDASQSKSKTNKLDDVATSRLINDLKKRNASLQRPTRT